MPAAFNPEAVQVDQNIGPNSTHANPGSRFNALDSRTGVPTSAAVVEAMSEFTKGTFDAEDLKQLAFAMGYQVVVGKNTAELVAKLADLDVQLGAMRQRAVNAEAAFAGKKNIDADAARSIAESFGFQVSPQSEVDLVTGQVAELTAAKSDLEKQVAELTAAKSDLEKQVEDLTAPKTSGQ